MLAGGRGGFFFTSKHRKVAVLLLLGGEGFGVGRVRRAVCRIKATLNLRAVSSSSLSFKPWNDCPRGKAGSSVQVVPVSDAGCGQNPLQRRRGRCCLLHFEFRDLLLES